MRILSLGFPMPGPQIDNHTFADAPSFFDYDAIVVEPLALSKLIEEVIDGNAVHQTRSGERLANAPTDPQVVGLADLLRERQEQTARLLAHGGIVVCFAYPNVVHQRVAGFSGCDRYFWLPAPAGAQYREPFLRRGAGPEVVPTEHDHPFGPYISELRGKLAYHAYFVDDAPALAGASSVFGRSAGGASVAVEFALAQGGAVFLPPPARPPTNEQRYAISTAIQEGIAGTLRLAATGNAPDWVDGYELPGLRERAETRDEARHRSEEAGEALAGSEEALDEVARYRRLLWQEGKFGLDEPVRAALTLIGLRVVPNDLDLPAELQTDASGHYKTVALLEVDAAVDAVGMQGHHRLRRRLEEAISEGKAKGGVLIINGHRTAPPSERATQYQDPLRVAAESMRYCVATTEQLFHAVRAKLNDDEATVSAFRERLLTTEGVLRED